MRLIIKLEDAETLRFATERGAVMMLAAGSKIRYMGAEFASGNRTFGTGTVLLTTLHNRLSDLEGKPVDPAAFVGKRFAWPWP